MVDSSADDERAAATYVALGHFYLCAKEVVNPLVLMSGTFQKKTEDQYRLSTTRHIYLAAICHSTINPLALRLGGGPGMGGIYSG